MKTKLIALMAALAFATTGLASAPARASEADNLVKLLVGVAVVGALVNAANQNNRRATVTRRYTPAPVYQPTRHYVRVRDNKPNNCLLQRWTARGWKTFYGRNCMRRLGWNRDRRGWYQNRVAYW